MVDIDRYALLRGDIVVNTAVWDGVTVWRPSDVVVNCPDHVSPGWNYTNGAWLAPPPPTEPPPEE